MNQAFFSENSESENLNLRMKTFHTEGGGVNPEPGYEGSNSSYSSRSSDVTISLDSGLERSPDPDREVAA